MINYYVERILTFFCKTTEFQKWIVKNVFYLVIFQNLDKKVFFFFLCGWNGSMQNFIMVE